MAKLHYGKGTGARGRRRRRNSGAARFPGKSGTSRKGNGNHGSQHDLHGPDPQEPARSLRRSAMRRSWIARSAGGRGRRGRRPALALRGADPARGARAGARTEAGTESFAESLSYFPEQSEYRLAPEQYLEHIRRPRRRSRIPVIASLNGVTPGGWTGYRARRWRGGGRRPRAATSTSWPPTRRRSGAGREPLPRDRPRGQGAGEDPGGGEASPAVHLDRHHGADAGRGGGRRACALQPVLPARFRSRGAGGHAQPRPLHVLREPSS